MKAQISRIFEVAMKELGQRVEQRGKSYRCPFCNKFKFGLKDELGAWHCFSGSCPHPNGGVIALIIALDLALDKTTAAKWLADRGLIPPSDKSRCGPFRPVVVRPEILEVDLNRLDDRQRAQWWESQWVGVLAVGLATWRRLRAFTGEQRLRRVQKSAKWYSAFCTCPVCSIVRAEAA